MEWIKLSDKKPTAYQSGTWDGLKSDEILVLTTTGRMYEGEVFIVKLRRCQGIARQLKLLRNFLNN